MSCIYLDNAATTPLCDEAAAAMKPYMDAGIAPTFGNANSLHTVGRAAFSALEDARMRTARALKCSKPDEIVFTGGATESDNAALVGIALGAREKARLQARHNANAIVMSRIEHEAVLETSQMLEALGFSVRFVENDRDGHISPDSLAQALGNDALLVSIMAANNEVGSVMDVQALAKVAHEAGAFFHTDAVQALGKIPVDLRAWGVDAASFSAHKVGGPKGVGVLYLKTSTPFNAYLAGGGQERGRRSGTQNVCGIAGAAAAIDHAVRNQEAFALRATAMRDRLYSELDTMKRVEPTVSVASGSKDFLPNIVNVCVRGIESQTIILQLDLKGICVSGGSACSSSSLGPSHVLSALGTNTQIAQGELRVSIGEQTTPEEIEAFLEAFKQVVA